MTPDAFAKKIRRRVAAFTRPAPRSNWIRELLPKSPSLAGLPDRQSQIEDASLQGNRYSVSAVGGIELGQNALHVCFDGSLGDFELGGDQLVRLPRRHTPQHFDLALAQCIVSNVFGNLGGGCIPYTALAGMNG